MPKYRATEHRTNLGTGIYKKGSIIEWSGWPRCHSGAVEAVDKGAKIIMRFWWSRQKNPNLPASPFNREHDRVFLPAHLPGDSRHRAPALPRVEHAQMPRYRVRTGRDFGGKWVDGGSEIAFLAWPPPGLEPVNAEAKRVVAYYAENRGHPDLLPAPWCVYAEDLFLPKLRGLTKRRRGDRDAEEEIQDLYVRRNAVTTPTPVRSRRSSPRRVA